MHHSSPEEYTSYISKSTGEFSSFVEEYSKDSHLPVSEVEKEREEYIVFNQLNNKTSFY